MTIEGEERIVPHLIFVLLAQPWCRLVVVRDGRTRILQPSVYCEAAYECRRIEARIDALIGSDEKEGARMEPLGICTACSARREGFLCFLSHSGSPV